MTSNGNTFASAAKADSIGISLPAESVVFILLPGPSERLEKIVLKVPTVVTLSVDVQSQKNSSAGSESSTSRPSGE